MDAPRRIPYRGKHVRLEPLDARRDGAQLYGASHGLEPDGPEPEVSEPREALWTYLGYGPFESPAAMQEWLATCERATDPLFFTVIENATDRRIGMASFLSMDAAARRLELGHIWYTPGAGRKRANTEAVLLLLGEAFDQLGCRRVEWKCDARNGPSRKAAERLGFTYEGTFRQHMIVKGKNRDTAWFSMLDAEWPAAKAELERALQ